MSFNGFQSTIKKGDTVILYLSAHQMYSVKAEPKTVSKRGTIVDNVFQTSFGALKCGELIGKEFGSKVNLSKGWGYILQPTPELWTLTLPHRTQIIYTPDVSMIVYQLELKPGSKVIETGTGSGSLSHALIRTIKPSGHLYTFDFHVQRVDIAKNEFIEHGLTEWVTINHRDVCSDGFGEELNNTVDAVFLDIPHPWLAVPHAFKSLKETGGRFCSFSPCIEQVQKTCKALSNLRFDEIQTLEVVQTQYSIQTKSLEVMNLEFVKTKKDDSVKEKKKKEVIKTVTALPPSTQSGHSGYLTFATLPPIWARPEKTGIEETLKSTMDVLEEREKPEAILIKPEKTSIEETLKSTMDVLEQKEKPEAILTKPEKTGIEKTLKSTIDVSEEKEKPVAD